MLNTYLCGPYNWFILSYFKQKTIMKTIFRFASIALIASLLFSCGNKETKVNDDEKKDSTEIADTSTPEPAVEEIALSLTTQDDPCMSGKPDVLHIKGGKPFDDEVAPYKVEAKKAKQGSIELGKFAKNEDGTYNMDILSTTNLSEDEVKIEIHVTDANGTVKTIDYFIPFCL